MTRKELRDYVEEQRSLNNIPYHVYSTLIDGIDTLYQESTIKNDLADDYISRKEVLNAIKDGIDNGKYTLDGALIMAKIADMSSVTPKVIDKYKTESEE